MKYFTYFAGSTVPRNKYQRAVVEVLKDCSHRVVNDALVAQQQILERIKAVHADYPRCKEMHAYFHEGRMFESGGAEFGLHTRPITTIQIQFFLYPIKPDTDAASKTNSER